MRELTPIERQMLTLFIMSRLECGQSKAQTIGDMGFEAIAKMQGLFAMPAGPISRAGGQAGSRVTQVPDFVPDFVPDPPKLKTPPPIEPYQPVSLSLSAAEPITDPKDPRYTVAPGSQYIPPDQPPKDGRSKDAHLLGEVTEA